MIKVVGFSIDKNIGGYKVYFIADDFNGPIKIGITKDLDSRLNNLQTGNPRSLKLMAFIKMENRKDASKKERSLHRKYKKDNVLGEWFSLDSSQVLDEIRAHPYTGFIAINKNALKFLEYTQDGLSIEAVWEWLGLDWEECCPYCGCICGLLFNENIMLHECLNCGYHLLDDGT